MSTEGPLSCDPYINCRGFVGTLCRSAVVQHTTWSYCCRRCLSQPNLQWFQPEQFSLLHSENKYWFMRGKICLWSVVIAVLKWCEISLISLLSDVCVKLFYPFFFWCYYCINAFKKQQREEGSISSAFVHPFSVRWREVIFGIRYFEEAKQTCSTT